MMTDEHAVFRKEQFVPNGGLDQTFFRVVAVHIGPYILDKRIQGAQEGFVSASGLFERVNEAVHQSAVHDKSCQHLFAVETGQLYPAKMLIRGIRLDKTTIP